MKHEVDEWVYYHPFPNSKDQYLRSIKQKSVILYINRNKKNNLYEYRIYNDVTGKVINTNQENLFSIETANYN